MFPLQGGYPGVRIWLVLVASLASVLRTSAQAPLTVDNISDRGVYSLRTWFRVPSNPGYSYRALLDGKPVPTDVTNWVDMVDYHELLISRTNVGAATISNRLVRFIVDSDRGNPENGLIRWTPYPPINSTAGELAGAQMRVITPAEYPTQLPVPVVVWLEDGQGRPRRANGFVTAPGFEATPVQVRRGTGSGFLPPATVGGPLDYQATLPGLQTNKQVQIDVTTTWTTRSGILATSETWPPNSRIHLNGNLTVPAGLTLTIGAGSIIKLNPLVNITNTGRVVIDGTLDQPVVFTATNVVAPERNAGAWGGFVMRGATAVLDANGAIFAGGAGGTGWSFSPGSSHRSEQAVLMVHSGARASLTNCAIISSAGQVANGYNSDVTYDHTLCQRAITCGEYEGGTITINGSAIIEFPNDDGVVNGTIADADYDGIYFTTGTHILKDSLFGFAKDDAIDSGSGGPGTMLVTNCWVESAQHEAHAWSGQGRIASSYDSVLMNSGQGHECGWSTGSDSPNCFADRMFTTGNSVGARIGDNYDWSYTGFLRMTNSLILYNYRDIFLKTWNTSGSGWDTNQWVDRLAQANLQSNSLTTVDARFPNNEVWNPARDGWRLAHWMTTPADAAVGVGFTLRTNQFAMTNLFDGVPVRLSSFTTNFVTVNYAFEASGSQLATGSLTFAPGETVKRIFPVGFNVAAQSSVQAVLRSAVRGELTGLTSVSFAGSAPSPQVSCWVGTNALPLIRLAEGMLVKLSTPSGLPVTVSYAYTADSGSLASGSLTFAPGETVAWIDPTGVDPLAHDPIRLTLSNPVNAALSGPTTVTYGTPPIEISLAVPSSQVDITTFSAGVAVVLNQPASQSITVDFRCEGRGAVLTNGSLNFAPGQTLQTLMLPTVNSAAYNLLFVSLMNAAGARLVMPSNVVFVRMETGASAMLVVAGSIWRYLDNGTDAGTAWRFLSFNDSGWKSGCAQLGYGDNDECTTNVSYGTDPNNKYITTYFRQKFVVQDPTAFTNLALWLLRDDGGVVYLNTNEVYRSPSMPGGTVTYLTLANAQGSTAPPDNTIDRANVSPTRLVAGTNIVAVEIHQHRGDSSDLSFDFSLTGEPVPPAPPQHLYLDALGGRSVVAWGDSSLVLQTSSQITGPWTNVVGAMSPYYINPGPGNAFYRLRK
jgi:hypothetical protein